MVTFPTGSSLVKPVNDFWKTPLVTTKVRIVRAKESIRLDIDPVKLRKAAGGYTKGELEDFVAIISKTHNITIKSKTKGDIRSEFIELFDSGKLKL